ncbi:MAG: protease inhibitor I42 family protein [Gaiellales bacterium]
MKKLHRVALLGALALVAIAAFAPIGSAATDSTNAIALKPGKKASFLVATNPSTGYAWKWTTAPDAAIAAGSEPKVLPKASSMVGVSQKARITITGKAPGVTTGVLSYIAPDGTTVGKTLTIYIAVG